MDNEKKKRIFRVVIGFLILLFVGFFYAAVITETGFIIKCGFREMTGWRCPGCGVTHMCLAIMKGDFRKAFEYNMALFEILPIIALILGSEIYRYIKGGEFSRKWKVIVNVTCICLVIFLVLWGIGRNIVGV